MPLFEALRLAAFAIHAHKLRAFFTLLGFGPWPAWKAARPNPVDALRFE